MDYFLQKTSQKVMSTKLLFGRSLIVPRLANLQNLHSVVQNQNVQISLSFYAQGFTTSAALNGTAFSINPVHQFVPARAHRSPSPILSRTLLGNTKWLSTTRILQEVQAHQVSKESKTESKPAQEDDDLLPEDEERGFARSEKANQAAKVNLSARLSKHGNGNDNGESNGNGNNQTAGWDEIWRLVKIARPEAKVLSLAFGFLLLSSSISMVVPFSIGKIIDIATKGDSETRIDQIFGLSLPTFYLSLGCLLTVAAAANYGRIVVLRIVGERIVARLRSHLFRQTFIQNAEFFDANRVGDLISRLSNDTIIVGKAITSNLSDGLRALVSGSAGIALMAYVSLKLTTILTLMFPFVAVGSFFYGKAIRNISRKIQRNLGTLSKIAEERLGSVRTSQAFAGEILEVARYNKQIKKVFFLGKTEALYTAAFFAVVCCHLQT